MKVILTQEVKGLGKKDAVVEVSEGYARNFLLPKKLAVPATDSNINTITQQKAAQARREQQQLDEAKMLASRLSKLSVTIPVKTGEGGKLFGSVTGKDVADALAKTHGVEIDRRKVELKDTVKAVGTFTVVIRVHPEIIAQIELNVVSAGDR